MFLTSNPQNIEKHTGARSWGGGGTGTWEAGPGRQEEWAAGRDENHVNPEPGPRHSTSLFVIQPDG